LRPGPERTLGAERAFAGGRVDERDFAYLEKQAHRELRVQRKTLLPDLKARLSGRAIRQRIIGSSVQ